MTDDERADTPVEERERRADGHPRGTLFLMLLFLVSIAAMWAYMYVLLLERG